MLARLGVPQTSTSDATSTCTARDRFSAPITTRLVSLIHSHTLSGVPRRHEFTISLLIKPHYECVRERLSHVCRVCARVGNRVRVRSQPTGKPIGEPASSLSIWREHAAWIYRIRVPQCCVDSRVWSRLSPHVRRDGDATGLAPVHRTDRLFFVVVFSPSVASGGFACARACDDVPTSACAPISDTYYTRIVLAA